jgi:hypothetical protein
LKFATDENLRYGIYRGVRRRDPHLDIVSVQDAGLSARDDSAVLEWVASEERVLFTQDVTTMKPCAEERIRQRLPMPGLFVVLETVPISTAIDEVLLIAECSFEGEWEWQIRFLPLK